MTEVKTVNIGPETPSEAQTATETPENLEVGTELPTEETDADEAVKAPEEDPKFAARFAALARQEEKARLERQEIKEAQEQVRQYNELKSAIKENPLAALEHLGVDLDALILASLGEDAPQEEEDPVTKLQREFEEYKNNIIKEKEDKEAAEELSRKEAEEAAIKSHQDLITKELEDNGDKYELIHLNNAKDLVWEVTEAHFMEHGEVLSPAQAADLVEAHLVEQFEKVANARKVKKEPVEETKPEEPKTVISSKTLTSSMASNTPQVKIDRKPASTEESKRNAASMLRWTD